MLCWRLNRLGIVPHVATVGRRPPLLADRQLHGFPGPAQTRRGNKEVDS